MSIEESASCRCAVVSTTMANMAKFPCAERSCDAEAGSRYQMPMYVSKFAPSLVRR